MVAWEETFTICHTNMVLHDGAKLNGEGELLFFGFFLIENTVFMSGNNHCTM